MRRIEKTDNPEKRKKLWTARKVAGGLMGQISPDNMVQDAVIPRHALNDTLQMIYREAELRNIEVLNVFHAGDGNLHPNFLFNSKAPEMCKKVEELGTLLMKYVIEIGGTLSGEHGIGSDKMKYVPLIMPPDVIKLQESILKVFNPENKLNPEKVFPMRSYVGCCTPRVKT